MTLKEYLVKYDLSYADMAKKLNCCRATIGHYITGHMQPSNGMKLLIKIVTNGEVVF